MENSLQLSTILFCFVLLANASEFGGLEPDGCKEARCGNDGPTIQFPFWLKDQQPEHCGFPGFELSCAEDDRTMLELPHLGKFYVDSISYTWQLIDLYDPDGCNDPRLVPNLTSSPFAFYGYLSNYTFFNCSTYQDSSWADVMRIRCLSTHHYQIVAIRSYEEASYAPQSCWKMYDSKINPFWNYDGRDQILLRWNSPNCTICYADGNKCIRAKGNTGTSETLCLPNISKQKRGPRAKLIGSLLGSFLLVLVFIGLYYIFRSNRLEKESQVKIEKFLQDYRALKPTRYTYSDIKRITNQFKDKLGQGVENTSQVYFPEWIYNQLDHGEDPGIQLEEERHAKIAKKLAIVGLWCIQWYPVNRPSMKIVVQMLEGEGDDLKIPPNPFESTHSTNQSLIAPGRRSHITLSVISESE
ncbi:hypothetical protein CMV_004375 [Castanea mollissima]|uniref:RING-type E3 ubiquitin transferase n=1 Tax=Castanea mollissima TaxID=60419 RepID=A0A8J4RFM8_9ROSI|nr:hypothetical protein CMV_004375 [Castanea mollissima]